MANVENVTNVDKSVAAILDGLLAKRLYHLLENIFLFLDTVSILQVRSPFLFFLARFFKKFKRIMSFNY